MTKEEAMKMAPGSIILVEAIVKWVEDNGVVAVSLHGDNRWHNFAFDRVYAKPEMPKYDPRRPFRRGDKVRVVECKGRNCTGCELGSIGEIALDEGEDDPIHGIGVDFEDGSAVYIDPAYLELVIPVEEMEPYSVQETMSLDGWQIVRDGLPLALYDSRRHPHAKAAAEAECKRLNSEHRKECKV